MSAKKAAALFLAPLFLSSLLLSQSLSEIAQKERARRAGLKGKKVTVITNADLAKMTKKPALEMPPSQPEPDAKPGSASPTAPESASAVSVPSGADAGPIGTPPPAAAPAEPSQSATLQELQRKLDRAKEYVELLTLKMGALWQERDGLRDQKAIGAVQLAIGETFSKLQTAQEEATRAQQELDTFLAGAKKDASSKLWIK